MNALVVINRHGIIAMGSASNVRGQYLGGLDEDSIHRPSRAFGLREISHQVL